MDLDGEFAELQLGYSHLSKDKDQVTKIMEIGNSEYMAKDFMTSGRLGYLFQNQGGEDYGAQHTTEKIHINARSMFSFLVRVSVGASYRFLRGHMNGDIGKTQAGYLIDDKFTPLGKVVHRCPLPFPIRTYDMCTQFQRECAAESASDLFGNDPDFSYGMPYIADVPSNMLKRILITSLVVRTAGRVEALRAYLDYTKKGTDLGQWKRLFRASDCIYLPIFIASSSGKRDACQAYNAKESMMPRSNDQYTTNLPNAVIQSPHSYVFFNRLLRLIWTILLPTSR